MGARNHSRRVRQSLKDRTLNAQASAARWQAAYGAASGLAESNARRKRELEGILREAVDIVGRMSVLFAPQNVECLIPRDVLRAYGIRVESRVDAIRGPGDWQETAIYTPVEALPVLLSYFRREDFDQCQHVVLELEDKRSGYAISRKAIELLSHRELEERIAHVFVPELVRHLVSQLKGPRR